MDGAGCLEEREFRWAIHYFDWSSDSPDVLTRRLLDSERIEEVANEAAICFRNSLGVVVGPYHVALERELARARSWKEFVTSDAGQQWLNRLMEMFKTEIQQERQRSEESEFY